MYKLASGKIKYDSHWSAVIAPFPIPEHRFTYPFAKRLLLRLLQEAFECVHSLSTSPLHTLLHVGDGAQVRRSGSIGFVVVVSVQRVALVRSSRRRRRLTTARGGLLEDSNFSLLKCGWPGLDHVQTCECRPRRAQHSDLLHGGGSWLLY